MHVPEGMPGDWAAVARAIDDRVRELGWRQRELAERSHVSAAVVREIQRHTVERRRSPRSPEVALRPVLNLLRGVRGELAGDRPGVAGHDRRGCVDLLEEHGQGAGDARGSGAVEGDGDRGGGGGDDDDGAGQAADDGFAGDGAVFAVVAR
jgi:hypothetical protein